MIKNPKRVNNKETNWYVEKEPGYYIHRQITFATVKLLNYSMLPGIEIEQNTLFVLQMQIPVKELWKKKKY